MRRIGLTQRVSVVEEYGERRDCLDQAWTRLFGQLDLLPVPLANRVGEVEASLDALALDGVVLTSGNDLAHLPDATNPAPERDRFERAVVDYAVAENLPVLGICRGLEMLNVYFGGDLKPVTDHVTKEHTVEFETPERLTDLRLPERVTVNSYHDYGIEPGNVAEELTVYGSAPDCTVECISHADHPIWGVMWHPERESPSAEFDRHLMTHLFGGERR